MSSGMFEQAVLPVKDAARFAEVTRELDGLFAPGNVARFLKRLDAARVRARDFDGALRRGLLGDAMPGLYGALEDSDRGQVREMYLRRVEQVAPELRAKYLKVYAYY